MFTMPSGFFAARSTAIVDPLWSSVFSLLYFNGSNGSTTIIDQKPRVNPFVAYGTAQIDTGTMLYGKPTLLVGTSHGPSSLNYISTDDPAYFNTGDFCVEWTQVWDVLTDYQTPFNYGYTSSGGILVQSGNGDGKLNIYVSGTLLFAETSSATVGSPIKYALERASGVLTLYKNGGSVGSATCITSVNINSRVSWGGTDSVGSCYPIIGRVSMCRITKAARYMGNYTPSTVAFPNS